MKKRFCRILFIITILILVGVCVFFVFWNPFLKLALIGEETLSLEVGETYKDAGVTATLFGKNIESRVVKKGKLNTKKVGEYTLSYFVSFLQTKVAVKRKIDVVDTEKPVITQKGEASIVLFVGDTYVEPGYQAHDLYEGNLTDKVIVTGTVDMQKVGAYTLKYTVTDSSGNSSSSERKVIVKEKPVWRDPYSYGDSVLGPTYIKGILIVNKKYTLPKDFALGVDKEAGLALEKLQKVAAENGYQMPLLSGYRTYNRQVELYEGYVRKDGRRLADTYSARPGHSEHQTGLTFDVASLSKSFGKTEAGIWLRDHCHEFGFIIRYPEGKEAITGYSYEPWHIRYVGSVATEIHERNLTLEEYLGI